MINVSEIECYKDYGKCLCISNGIIEAYVTLDIGPRIIRFGFAGERNVLSDIRCDFKPITDQKYQSFFGKGRAWESLGGHRVWITPESYPETYLPDDRAVEYELCENGAIFKSIPDTEVGIEKTLTVKMDTISANMSVTMDVKNISSKSKEFAVWAISVCSKGGTLIIPMNINDTGYLHNRSISVWPYTDMGDRRIHWGKKYVTVSQNSGIKAPLKLGFDLHCGKSYYVLDNEAFCKSYDVNHQGLTYPDGGCSFETYTNDVMIEIETLSPLKMVQSGNSHSLTEHWSLTKNNAIIDFNNEESIENFLNNL